MGPQQAPPIIITASAGISTKMPMTVNTMLPTGGFVRSGAGGRTGGNGSSETDMGTPSLLPIESFGCGDEPTGPMVTGDPTVRHAPRTPIEVAARRYLPSSTRTVFGCADR